MAEALLADMNVDAYFLEYDDARSGDFMPSRYSPNGKTVVLGLVTTKLGTPESNDDLKRRIDEAALYAAGATRAVAAVRIFEHRAWQRHRGGGAARKASIGDRNSKRSVR